MIQKKKYNFSFQHNTISVFNISRTKINKSNHIAIQTIMENGNEHNDENAVTRELSPLLPVPMMEETKKTAHHSRGRQRVVATPPTPRSRIR